MGNTRQIQLLFQKYSASMLLYANSLAKDVQSAEDIVQEIFVALMKKQTIPENPQNYLIRAVRNRMLNEHRKRKLQALREDTTEQWFTQPIEKQEEREQLTKALKKLPEEQREVIVLKIWNQMSFQEIAKLLEISQNTAGSRYRYGLEKLQQAMRCYYERA